MHFFKKQCGSFAKTDVSMLIKTKYENENKTIVKSYIDDKVLARIKNKKNRLSWERG